ncbi:TPA: hypothetical protein L3686_002132 [Pseudomonas aeruginosa]|nr:hypothetical protein [Pseudomonas aeruginosa]
MDIERTHIHSQHGINFSLAIIRLAWAERSRLLHREVLSVSESQSRDC